MVWYEEFDFVSNPFTIKPQEDLDDFHGQKEIIKEANKVVSKGGSVVIHGPYGCGKTTILKGVIDRFKGKRKVAYYNAFTSERSIDFEDILVNGGSRISTFFGIKTKEMILLLDEAHNLMKKDFEELVEYYHEGYFKSIVFVTSESDYKFPDEVNDIIDENVFELKMFSEKDAINFCEERLEGVELLDKKSIKEIYKSAKSPRDFIMKCEDVCRHAVERGSEAVGAEDIKAVC